MRPLLTALALAVALTGCGSKKPPSAEAQVRSTLQSFVTAVEKRQYQKLCDEIFAPALLKQAQSIGLPCEVAMRTSLEDVRDPKLTVGTVKVTGKTASAEIKTAAAGQPPSTDTIRLQRLNGRWRVSALGPGGQPQPAASASATSSP